MLKIEKKAVKAGRRVDTSHVNETIRNYKKERWVHNSKRLGREDSLSVWYSIEELQEFMEEAKMHGSDGVRLYFGAYDKVHAPVPGYQGRQTIVLVATKEKTFEGRTINKDVYVPTENGISIFAYNVGHVCPPFCTRNDDGEIGISIIDEGDQIVVA